MGLAVAVDTAVALLDADQGPGDVVVDELVALAVEVDTLRCHVSREQDAHGGVRQAEVLDTLHLLLVGETAVHDPRGLLQRLPLEAESRRDRPTQPLQRLDALGEHHDPGVALRADPDGPELLDEGFELRRVLFRHAGREVFEAVQRVQFGAWNGVFLRGERLDARVDRRPQSHV